VSRIDYLIAVLMAAVFTIDCLLPVGYAVWLLYALPHILTTLSKSVYAPLVAGGIIFLLTGLGYVLSPGSVVPFEVGLFNRSMCMLGIVPMSIGVYLQKVNQRRRVLSDARGQLFFDRMPVGCTITDANLIPREWNAAAERLFGFAATEIIGKPASETISPPELWSGLPEILIPLRRGQEHISINPNRTKDGRTIWCQWYNTPLFDNGAFAGVLSMVLDVTDRRQAENSLKRMSARILAAQEQERRAVARELHDEVGQVLTAVSMNLQNLQSIAPPEAQALIEDGNAVVAEAIRRVRGLSLDLRPPMLDDFGLIAAVQWYADQQAKRANLPIRVRVSPEFPRLEPEQEAGCYRIIQEAVTNALRYARSSQIDILVDLQDKGLQLSVRDDGLGFDPSGSAVGFGLTSMRERAALLGGNLELQTAPGSGTNVTARIPR
jgi:PAS domain S-box-containing protein